MLRKTLLVNREIYRKARKYKTYLQITSQAREKVGLSLLAAPDSLTAATTCLAVTSRTGSRACLSSRGTGSAGPSFSPWWAGLAFSPQDGSSLPGTSSSGGKDLEFLVCLSVASCIIPLDNYVCLWSYLADVNLTWSLFFIFWTGLCLNNNANC